MSQRDEDLRMLGELLDKHAHELDDRETEAFAGMRYDMTAYANEHRQETLTTKQRWWVNSTYERLVPQYANLVSQGLVPKGTPTHESKALDAMLAKPIPARRVSATDDGDVKDPADEARELAEAIVAEMPGATADAQLGAAMKRVHGAANPALVRKAINIARRG